MLSCYKGALTSNIGVIAGTMDSIKSISSMTKNGIVEGPAGKEIDQVETLLI